MVQTVQHSLYAIRPVRWEIDLCCIGLGTPILGVIPEHRLGASFLRLGLAVGLGLIALDALPAAAQAQGQPEGRWQLTLDDQRYVWNIRLVKLVLQETTLLVGDGHESAVSTLAGESGAVYDFSRLGSAERRLASAAAYADLRGSMVPGGPLRKPAAERSSPCRVAALAPTFAGIPNWDRM